MKQHKSIFDQEFNLTDIDYSFDYQKDLTDQLDNHSDAFDQNIINEIVLWKVNRYVRLDVETLLLINGIDRDAKHLNIDQTRSILKKLLRTKGIKLPMASTILRFKNKHIYQIIDQRVYRIINPNKKLKLSQSISEKNLDEQIDLYMRYLVELGIVCNKLNIPFSESDRILFMADRRINKDVPLDNY